MVSKSNTIIVDSTCVCGVGDKEISHKAYYENKCPACDKEGTLQVETTLNVEGSNQPQEEGEKTDITQDSPTAYKIVCKNCGSEFCGQDGYDLAGGSRASLTSVNPNQITEDEDNEVSEEQEDEPTYMSGWEGLCDLLKPLDGLAMMVQRGDYVIVKRIEMPQSARLWAYEGINVVHDSVKITDYTPEIYNTFVILWGESYENEMTFVFDKHKKLFGERKVVIEAKKVQVVKDNDDEKDDSEEKKDDSWSITDLLFGSSSETEKVEKNTTSSDLTTDNEGTDSEESNTEEVPITTREEAIRFGLTEVGKAKRDDGHTVELKVIGNQVWQVGEWCHVKLPSFNEDSYMFISKCNFESAPDNEYLNTLTFVDYPPSLGKPNKSETKDNNTEEDSSNNQEDKDNNENATGTDSSNTDNSQLQSGSNPN